MSIKKKKLYSKYRTAEILFIVLHCIMKDESRKLHNCGPTSLSVALSVCMWVHSQSSCAKCLLKGFML